MFDVGWKIIPKWNMVQQQEKYSKLNIFQIFGNKQTNQPTTDPKLNQI